MQYSKLKLFRPVNDLIIPPAGINGKNICITPLCENHNFLDCLNYLQIKRQHVRYYFVPSTSRPRTLLTPEYRDLIKERKLVPVKGQFGNYDILDNKNFYLDIDSYLNSIINLYRLRIFNNARAYNLFNKVVAAIDGVTESMYERVLLYTVNLEAPIPEKLINRKIFPIFNKIINWNKDKSINMPFDKLLLFFYDYSGGRFVLLFDRKLPVNVGRLKNILLKLNTTDSSVNNEEEKDELVDHIADNELPEEIDISNKDDIKEKVKTAIKTYMAANPDYNNASIDKVQDKEELTNGAIAYQITGNVDKAKSIAKKIKEQPPEIRKQMSDRLIRDYEKDLIIKREVRSTSSQETVSLAKPNELVDNQVPTHIIDKRKRDFKELLREDLISAFKPFEDEQVSLKIKSVKVKTIKDPVSNLKPTLTDRYFFDIVDSDGKMHKIYLDLPHLTENGSFLVYGQPKVIINQLVLYPIFFLAPYIGKFESIYSAITIYSVKRTKSSFLQFYMVGYKQPLMTLFGYKVGFKETMKLYNIQYEITEEKQTDSIKLYDRYLNLKHNDDVGYEMVESLKQCIPYFPKNFKDIESPEFWKQVLINQVGTKNCVHMIDQAWKYVVTPVEEKILKSKGDPTNIRDILHYISVEVVHGRVDDRNAVDKQRIRTSEVFSHLIQKQLIASYNEFLAKKLGGDEEARMSVNAKKAFSEVVNSQNVQTLESINPLEELSMMTRILPTGVGGIPSKEAFPERARNIHYSYYGNIDPLETPDGPDIGIQQHLTVGAAISNSRGLFAVKDRNMVKPTEILSVGPAMVPFVESNDGARVIMGTGQTKQAFPLLVPEPPAIQTGYESLLTNLLSDNFIKRSPVKGQVVSIESNMIIIKDAEGKEHAVDTKPRLLRSGQGKHGLGIFKPVVTIGQKVVEGQVLSEGGNVSRGTISNGINVLVAMMPWKGYNFEDGGVVSEKIVNKFTTAHIDERVVMIEEDDEIINIASIGDKLEKGEIILTQSKALYDVESYKHTRVDGGTISEIEVYCNIEESKIPDKLRPAFERFRSYFKKINGSYPIGSFNERNIKFEGIMIKFTLVQELVLGKGDKVNNRHGNKGVIAIVEKEENMPLTPWGERIEMVLNPLGVVNRMNNGQLFEMHCGLISKKLGELIVQLPRVKFFTIYSRVLGLLDGTENKKYSKNVLQGLRSMTDKQYQALVNDIRTSRFMPLIFPPFKSPARENIGLALGVLGLQSRYPVKLEEFDMTTSPVAVGYMYIQKLEHLAEKKISSRSTGPYTSATLAPTSGKKRSGGQKIGELDVFSLLAWDVPYVIEEFLGPMSSDHPTKNEMVSDLIQRGRTNFRQTKTNPVKEQLSQFMLAIHLTSV